MHILKKKMPIIRTLLILALMVIPPSVALGKLFLQAESTSSVQAQGENKNIGPLLHLLPGADWPMYLHDIQHTSASGETTLSPVNVGQLINHWQFKTGGTITASPSIVGGTVYVGSWDGYEYALDALTGVVKWKTFLGTVTKSADCNAPGVGITSSAAVQNDIVYLGADTYWYALDALTGAVVWKTFIGDHNVHGGHYNWSSPLIYQGFAYVGVVSEGECPPLPDKLMKVSLSMHRVVATFQTVLPEQIPRIAWTAPSIDPQTNTMYVTAGVETSARPELAQSIYSLDAGTLALKDKWSASELSNAFGFETTPILFGDAKGRALVAAMNENGYVYVFDRSHLSTGPLWQQEIASPGACSECIISSSTFGRGILYMASSNLGANDITYRGTLDALDPATGKLLWREHTPGSISSALAYTGGLLIDSTKGALEVRDATTGKRLYSYQTFANHIYAAAAVSHGQIFTADAAGIVYAFGLPTTPTPPPPFDPNCPRGWVCQDIGTPGLAGSETYTGNVWNVHAADVGIGGISDQLRLITRSLQGDTQIRAHVMTQKAAQAGLMIRQTNDASSPNYSVFLTKSGEVVAQYRKAFGGETIIDSHRVKASSPLYLEIQRLGDQFWAATSTDGVTFTPMPGSAVELIMPETVIGGLAVSSSDSETLDTVIYSAVTIGPPMRTT